VESNAGRQSEAVKTEGAPLEVVEGRLDVRRRPRRRIVVGIILTGVGALVFIAAVVVGVVLTNADRDDAKPPDGVYFAVVDTSLSQEHLDLAMQRLDSVVDEVSSDSQVTEATDEALADASMLLAQSVAEMSGLSFDDRALNEANLLLIGASTSFNPGDSINSGDSSGGLLVVLGKAQSTIERAHSDVEMATDPRASGPVPTSTPAPTPESSVVALAAAVIGLLTALAGLITAFAGRRKSPTPVVQ
jgi:hypothetical protein